MDPDRAQMVTCTAAHSAHANNLEPIFEKSFDDLEDLVGARFYFSHRVDLHNELKLMATTDKGPGKPATIHLSSAVKDAVRSA